MPHMQEHPTSEGHVVTARADALAAFERIHARVPQNTSTEAPDEYAMQDAALVRAALAPDLPADLAEIQARTDEAAEQWKRFGNHQPEPPMLADRRALVAELAERRARPTLTPEQAHELFIRLLGRTCDHDAWVALSAIARLHTPKTQPPTGS